MGRIVRGTRKQEPAPFDCRRAPSVATLCSKLQAFADGELPAVDAERMRGHLLSCKRCATVLPELQAVNAAIEDGGNDGKANSR